MKKCIISVVFLFVFVFYAVSGMHATGAVKQDQTQPKDTDVLQKVYADVTGDGHMDAISLLGRKYDKTSPYLKNIYLLVNRKLIGLPKEWDGGYDPELMLGDFDGDRVDDIFISSATGGSGGIMYYHIFSLKGGTAKLIFSPVPESAIAVKGSFQPDYKVTVTVMQTKKTYSLDFTDRRSTYDDPGVGLYKKGKLLKKTDVNIDYYGLLTPVDVDMDGTFELQGVQSIWGAVHVDTLAEVESTWKWNKSKWNVLNVSVIRNTDVSGDTSSK